MEDVLLYGDRSNKLLSKRLSSELGIKVNYSEVHDFPDGERRIRINQKVAGRNVLVLKSFTIPIDSNILNFIFTVDALKLNGANKIIAVIPYFPYQRSDHVFRAGEGVPLKVIINIFETLKIDNIITLDLHSIKIQEMFSMPVTHLTAIPLFVKEVQKMKVPLSKISIVSPDMGGLRRAKQMAKLLGGVSYVGISKDRDLETGKIDISKHSGDIKKVCIILDDICSTGNTIVKASDYLHLNGAERTIVMCTHPVLSKDSSKLLQNSKVEKFYMTDSIYVPTSKKFRKLEIISIDNLIKSSLHNQAL